MSSPKAEYRLLILTVAARVTDDGSLRSLARKLGVGPDTLSAWIRRGDMPPTRAREILMLEGVNPPNKPTIHFSDLVPSFEDVL